MVSYSTRNAKITVILLPLSAFSGHVAGVWREEEEEEEEGLRALSQSGILSILITLGWKRAN